MTQYLRRGLVPKKRRTLLRKPEGGIYYEHSMSADGFAGDHSFLYHLREPSRVLRVDDLPSKPLRSAGPPIGRNLLFKLNAIVSDGDFIDARVPSLFSSDETFVLSIAKPTRPMERFYCNATADELILVIQGSGTLESWYGDIRYEAFDLVYVPRGDVVRWVPDGGAQELAVIESRSPLRSPAAFVKPNGQFDDNASYHERDLRTPQLRKPADAEGEYAIVTKVGTRFACSYLDHHPHDVVGWDGCLYPYAFSLRDYEPLVGAVFLTPDQYAVFETATMVIAAITPRRGADHPDAAFANSFHQNLDYDEVLLRFAGSVRATETPTGTFTLTPRAIMHGPKRGFEQAQKRTQIDMWGLMMDTRLTLQPTMEAMTAHDSAYARTWVESQLAGAGDAVPQPTTP